MSNNFLKNNNPFWYSAFLCIKNFHKHWCSEKVGHKHILITKNKRRALNCKNWGSLHVTKLPHKHLKGFIRKYNHWSIYFIQNLLVCILSKKCQIVNQIYVDHAHYLKHWFLIFAFVGFLHLSHCSILVSILGYSLPAQLLTPLQDSTLSCCIPGLYILWLSHLIITFPSSIKHWLIWWCSNW